MTREEQIRQAGIEYTYKDKPMCIGCGIFSEVIDEMNRNHAFEEGAKWADKTMIERACEWLEDNIFDYPWWDDDAPSFDDDDIVNDFRKAMEE